MSDANASNHPPMPTRPYYDLGPLRRWMGFGLIAYILGELLYAVFSFQMLDFIDAILAGEMTEAEMTARATSIDQFGLIVAIAILVPYILCCVQGCVWTYRASSNAAALTPDPRRITPGWAVGWYFIPFANLFKPFQAVREIYNGSVKPPFDLNKSAPSLYNLWWGCWILILILLGISTRMGLSDDIDTMRSSYVMDLFITVLTVLSVYLWWRVVSAITALQADNSPTSTVSLDQAAGS